MLPTIRYRAEEAVGVVSSGKVEGEEDDGGSVDEAVGRLKGSAPSIVWRRL